MGDTSRTSKLPDSWRPVDLAAVMADIRSGDIERPTPTVGQRSDGSGLFYPGRLNGLVGRYGSAKSFVAMCCAIQEIRRGNRVWWVDFEDDPYGTAERAVDLGASDEAVSTHLTYINPSEPLSKVTAPTLIEGIEKQQPVMVVIDSGGEWMSLQGIQPNHDEEVAAFYKTFVGPFTRAGAAVVAVDHVPHEAKDKLRAAGSQRKGAAVSGAAYLVETTIELGRGRKGKAKLVSIKDRLGHYPRGSLVAELTIDATQTPYSFDLRTPVSPAEWQPTHLMEQVSLMVEKVPAGVPKRALREGVEGKNEWIDRAVEELIAGGYMHVAIGARGVQLHKSIKPYREDGTGQQTLEDQPGLDPDKPDPM